MTVNTRRRLLFPAVLSALLVAGVLVALYAGGVLTSHDPEPRRHPPKSGYDHGPPPFGMPLRFDRGGPGPGKGRSRLIKELPVKHSHLRALLRLRIGFSVPTALHCALGEIFLRTDILEKHGFLGELIPLPKGRDQHEASRRGMLDATFTCETPAIIHLDRLPGLALVGSPGSLGDIALVVPGDSDIRDVADLRGRPLAVLGGSSSHLLLERWLTDPDTNRPAVGRTIMFGGQGDEAVAALLAGEVSAAVLWDPWLTHQMSRENLHVVARAETWSALAMHASHLPDGYLDKYLAAIRDALVYGAAHFDEVVGWVSDRGGISRETVAAVLKKNEFLNGTAAPNLEISQAQMERLDRCETQAIRSGEARPSFRLAERIWTGEQPARLPAPQPRPEMNELVLIPGGVFQMGALNRDRFARPCERPRHEVTLSDFYLQKHAVTVAEYRMAVEQGVLPVPGCGTTEEAEEWYCNWDKPGREEHPVNGVSWFAADTYCHWLGMRLPTEAEFEFALAGGETDSLYPWGLATVPPDEFGNYVDEETEVPIKHWFPIPGRADGYSGTSPVGSFPVNRYGLQDISGNVWEWTRDWFGETSFTEEAEVDPKGPTHGEDRTMRGCGFSSILEEARISERHHKPPANDSIYIGFRCARSVQE